MTIGQASDPAVVWGKERGFKTRLEIEPSSEQVPGERRTPRYAQKAVWMRGTWGETRKRKTTDSLGNFEAIFSEPVAPTAGEADWPIGNYLRNFRGKHSRTRKNGRGRDRYPPHRVWQIRYFPVVYLF